MLRVDFFETFALITQRNTIRMLLALAAQEGWKVYQLDVKSTLRGDLCRVVKRFPSQKTRRKGLLVKKGLVGFKQALRA